MLLDFFGAQPSGSDINTPEIAKILAAQSGKGAPNLNAPSVKAARQHVEDVKTQNDKDLAAVENESLTDAGQDAYQAALKKADSDYQAAVKKINAAYDAEIKRINALPESNDQLKASLEQTLADLKKGDQAKLDDLKKRYEDKIAQIKAGAEKELANYKQELQEKLNSVDPEKAQQIKDLKAQHEAFIQANAKKLADLQAADAASLIALKAKLNAELATLHASIFPEKSQQQNAKNVANGNVQVLVMANGKAVTLPKAYAKTQTSNQSNKKLPETGNKSNAGLILMALASMLTFSVAGLKKRE